MMTKIDTNRLLLACDLCSTYLRKGLAAPEATQMAVYCADLLLAELAKPAAGASPSDPVEPTR